MGIFLKCLFIITKIFGQIRKINVTFLVVSPFSLANLSFMFPNECSNADTTWLYKI